MYYRKYFSGSVENANLTRSIVLISNNTNNTEYYVQSDVVCRAIKETLEDVGITCIYSSENSTLVIDGITVQIVRLSYIYYNAYGAQLGYQSSYPFSGNIYKFYITLKGDIDSVLNISIGFYNSPSYELYGFTIGKGKDLKDGSPIRACGTIQETMSSSSNFYVIKGDEVIQDCKNKIIFGGTITNTPALNANGTEVTLVECVAQSGRFKLDNCYFGNDVLNNGEFYNIGGEIYYKQSKYLIAKCVNKQAP